MEECDSSKLVKQEMTGNENPWCLASSNPAGTYKATLDVWNADHRLHVKSRKDKKVKIAMALQR